MNRKSRSNCRYFRWNHGCQRGSRYKVPIEKVPKYQKQIIDLCRKTGKFVIVNRMLESMIEHPFPTRAEVSDIFRAVLQWADATMLSWETTTGKYPLESVHMMRSVILEAEWELEHKHHEYENINLTPRDIEKISHPMSTRARRRAQDRTCIYLYEVWTTCTTCCRLPT